jgi:hypothetical protein
MSIYSGPEIAPTANLVFAYDTRNSKSYAGPETVNLTTNPLPNGTAVGFVRTGAGLGNNFAVYDATEQAIWWHVENYDVWGAYMYWDPVFTGTLDTSNNYTISFEWKTKNNANTASSLQFQLIQGNGVSGAMSSSVLTSLSTIKNDGWRVFKYTATPSNSGVGAAYMRVIFSVPSYYAANSNTTDFFIRKIQFEKQPFQTPFVVGTRSNTQVLTDLTRRTQITANSLTYDNSSFSFNVSKVNNIQLPNTPTLQFLGTAPYALEAWVYPTADPGTTNYSGIINRESRIDGSKRDGYNLWLITDVSNTQNLVLATERFTSNVSNTAFGVYITVTASTILNNWSHIVASYDGARVKLYLNSNYLGQSSVDAGSISNEQKTLEIGRRGADSQCFTGRIDGVKIYNKALSAKEVKQNFIALKGRYGL